MKFFVILLVVCGLAAGLWFAYDPYIKPLIEGDDGPALSDSDPIGKSSGESKKDDSSAPASKPKGGSKAAPEVAKTQPKSAAPAEPEEEKSELDLLLEKKYPMPEILPLEQIVDGWNNVPQRAFPDAVTASETIPFQLVVNGQAIGSSNVAPGTPLKPISLEGGALVIGNPANPGMNATIAVDKTDFKKRITDRYNQFVEKVTGDVKARREQVREMVEADPSKLALLTGESKPTTSADDPRIEVVKQSLRNGDAASVQLDEARTFTWNGSERVGGDLAGTYDTVTVHFEVATIFGRFPVDYKALLQGGKVVAWIDPITEERL